MRFLTKYTYSNFNSKKPSPFFGPYTILHQPKKKRKKEAQMPYKLGLQNPNKYTKTTQTSYPQRFKLQMSLPFIYIYIYIKNCSYATSFNRASGNNSHQQISPTQHLFHLHSSASTTSSNLWCGINFPFSLSMFCCLQL